MILGLRQLDSRFTIPLSMPIPLGTTLHPVLQHLLRLGSGTPRNLLVPELGMFRKPATILLVPELGILRNHATLLIVLEVDPSMSHIMYLLVLGMDRNLTSSVPLLMLHTIHVLFLLTRISMGHI